MGKWWMPTFFKVIKQMQKYNDEKCNVSQHCHLVLEAKEKDYTGLVIFQHCFFNFLWRAQICVITGSVSLTFYSCVLQLHFKAAFYSSITLLTPGVITNVYSQRNHENLNRLILSISIMTAGPVSLWVISRHSVRQKRVRASVKHLAVHIFWACSNKVLAFENVHFHFSLAISNKLVLLSAPFEGKSPYRELIYQQLLHSGIQNAMKYFPILRVRTCMVS